MHEMCCFEQPMVRSVLDCLFIVEKFHFLSQRKANVMNVHSSLKPALWGAAGGAAALAIIGFGWGGWITGGSADNRASSAVVLALAPVCLDQFQRTSNSVIHLTELKRTPSYDRGSFVEKAGWATMPGSTAPSSGVAKACAALIAKLE
jgi:hypothetical protein